MFLPVPQTIAEAAALASRGVQDNSHIITQDSLTVPGTESSIWTVRDLAQAKYVLGTPTANSEGTAVSDIHHNSAADVAQPIVPPVCETCTLDCARKGDMLEIISVDDKNARMQALRFGVVEGANVECVTKIPAGPLVIKSGRQEIAVGRSLAKRISVRRLSS